MFQGGRWCSWSAHLGFVSGTHGPMWSLFLPNGRWGTRLTLLQIPQVHEGSYVLFPSFPSHWPLGFCSERPGGTDASVCPLCCVLMYCPPLNIFSLVWGGEEGGQPHPVFISHQNCASLAQPSEEISLAPQPSLGVASRGKRSIRCGKSALP